VTVAVATTAAAVPVSAKDSGFVAGVVTDTGAGLLLPHPSDRGTG
jgi:hypothetical protein